MVVGRHRRSALLLVLPCGALGGCDGAPAVNVVGSFFPSAMLCALGGIAAAVLLRSLLLLAGLGGSLVAPPLTYAAVATAVTAGTWLLLFGH